MRYDKEFFDTVNAGMFVGDKRPCGRVTIEADWKLNTTPNGPNWGNSIRGPYRWYQNVNNAQVEYEIPGIKSISIDSSLSQDISSCSISLYNQLHDNVSVAVPESLNQLGKPGYYWPGHGKGDAATVWDQNPAQGAYNKAGTWVPGFNWASAIVPYGLIRTYQGYGGHAKSVTQALADGDIYQTGVWLIDTVTGSSDGMLSITCKDIGKLLLDQLVMSPLVPDALYPLSYVPAGKSAFDSYWEPRARTGTVNASQGRVKLAYNNSSSDVRVGGSNTAIQGHYPSEAIDGQDATFALSNGFAGPDSSYEWFEYKPFNGGTYKMDQISLAPWAGGYTCYISVMTGNAWNGSSIIPTTSIPYVTKLTIPLAIPDGLERTVNISLPQVYDAQYIRVTFTHMYYGSWGNSTGDTGPYRCGIRDLKAYVKNTDYIPNYGNPTPDDNWTHALAAHPTRGYWVADRDGYVYGFGDASQWDSDQFGQVYMSGDDIVGGNWVYGLAAHPSGKGYWALKRNGEVQAFGEAQHYGDLGTYIGPDPWGAEGIQAFDIAATHTGLGYYVVYGDGKVMGFGDAINTPGMTYMGTANPGGGYGPAASGPYSMYSKPQTSVDIFMNQLPITILVPADNPLGFTKHDTQAYWLCRRGTSVAAHPTQLGFWMVTGSGEVGAVNVPHYGELLNRTYNENMADNFHLSPTEFPHAIRSTKTGQGYWIAFGSGHIAAYGDAVGQGPTYIYHENPALDLEIPDTSMAQWEFFRALIWSLAPDPDGRGFWLLSADGNIGSYDASFWGAPGYYGMSGFKWFEGNYSDYSDIVKDVLLWGGFTLYNASQPGNQAPPVYGNIESTGIPGDAKLPGDQFDKKTLIDVIKTMKEIVGYSFWIDAQGAANFTSPNWWQAGNFDFAGAGIYVDVDGNRVSAETPGAVPFIPVISEEEVLTGYSATLNGDGLRSQIVIGTDAPDPKNPSSTGFTRFYPRTATDQIRPGVPALRNIVKPAMWINQNFTNSEEQRLMAELINLQVWFAQRAGTVQTVGNPLIGINDQIKIMERNTSDTFIHYVRGCQSEMDLDTGVYTMTLTTNWLGDADNWVITADSTYSPIDQVKVSNAVYRWQQGLSLGLSAGDSAESPDILSATGGFSSITIPYNPGSSVPYESTWKFNGTISAQNGVEDFVVETVQLTGNLGRSQYNVLGVVANFAALPVGAAFGAVWQTIDNGHGWMSDGNETWSDLGSIPVPIYMSIYSGATLIDTVAIASPGESATMESTVDLPAGNYTYTITGTPTAPGSATLMLRFSGSNVKDKKVEDSTILVAVPTVKTVTATTAISIVTDTTVMWVGTVRDINYTTSVGYPSGEPNMRGLTNQLYAYNGSINIAWAYTGTLSAPVFTIPTVTPTGTYYLTQQMILTVATRYMNFPPPSIV